MIGGGLLIAYMTLEHTLVGFCRVDRFLDYLGSMLSPDLKERTRTPVLKIWGTVDNRIKTLGLRLRFLNGALDAWGVVVLPVYLTQVLGVAPAFVGTVMMAEYVFHGLCCHFFL